jgi:hypothetical protein
MNTLLFITLLTLTLTIATFPTATFPISTLTNCSVNNDLIESLKNENNMLKYLIVNLCYLLMLMSLLLCIFSRRRAV